MANLPTGTVTLLFTDIEGSTRLLLRLGDRYATLLEDYRKLLRGAFQAAGGYEIGTEGDALFVAFARARDAVEAALAAQRGITSHAWPDGLIPRTRMALHTGEPQPTGNGYVGLDVQRVARLSVAAHGGQVLLSETTHALVAGNLPPDAGLLDLGTHRLKDLPQPERIFQLVAADLPSDFPPLRTLERNPNNLPALRDTLIGREREVVAVRQLLLRDDVRLVTLTGPGGTGKTRLALQVAAGMPDAFVDGVWFVNLAPISQPELVAPAIAQTLGVKETGQSVRDSLKAYLRSRQLLLVLDNFEQVVDAASLVAELLAAPGLKVLVTSRIVLHLSAEHEYPVPPLTLPDLTQLLDPATLSHNEAVALFTTRAVDVAPDFQITNANAPAVAEICIRLDGLPLAIELAAARVRLLPPQALLARLSKRLNVLTSGARDLPARQQTLRATIDWSYNLLTPGEQTLFTRLGVFVGGCTLAAAEAVCGPVPPVLDGLQSLLDKSLLRRGQDADHEPRFTMLEMLREYALERLAVSGELASLQHRHATYFLSLAEAAASRLTGPHQATTLQELQLEHDNLRAAIQWALRPERTAGEVELGARLGAALGRFWWTRGFLSEGRRTIEALLAQGEMLPAALRAELMSWSATIAMDQGDYVHAGTRNDASLALYRQLGNRQGMVAALNAAGWLATWQNNYTRAQALLEECVALAHELHSTWHVAMAGSHLAWLALLQDDRVQARARFEESLRLFRSLDSEWGAAWSLYGLGQVALVEGDRAAAGRYFRESLAIWHTASDLRRIGYAVEGLAGVAGAEAEVQGHEVGAGRAEQLARRAARLWGAAEVLRETLGAPGTPYADYRRETYLAQAQAYVDKETWQAAWDEGRAMTLEQAIAYALEGVDDA